MEAMDELALRRQFEEAQRHALRDPIKAAIARITRKLVGVARFSRKVWQHETGRTSCL